MLNKLKKYDIILASSSPRRQELLRQMGIDFRVVVRDELDESYPSRLTLKWVPEYVAKQKAMGYSDLLLGNTVVITADTMVASHNAIMGKPRTRYEAHGMLKRLQNSTHKVITGVAISTFDKQVTFSCKTKVTFSAMSDDIIDYYIEQYKPYDKAGSYGIQDWIGLIGVNHIEGSYQNVMGLPTQKLFQELMNL